MFIDCFPHVPVAWVSSRWLSKHILYSLFFTNSVARKPIQQIHNLARGSIVQIQVSLNWPLQASQAPRHLVWPWCTLPWQLRWTKEVLRSSPNEGLPLQIFQSDFCLKKPWVNEISLRDMDVPGPPLKRLVKSINSNDGGKSITSMMFQGPTFFSTAIIDFTSLG